MDRTRFHGVFPYLASPIDEAGEVKAQVLARLCEDLIGAGVHGLTPLGLEAGTIALLGAAVLLLLSRLDVESVLREVEWPTLFFFIGGAFAVLIRLELATPPGDLVGDDPANADVNLQLITTDLSSSRPATLPLPEPAL